MLWHFKEKTRASEHWSTQILSQHLTGRVYIWVSLCPYWLGKEMAIHFSTLAWKIPWMEESGRLQSTGLLGVRHDWVTSLFTFMHWRRKRQPARVLAWRIPGMGEPGRLLSMGSHRAGHGWSDFYQQQQQWGEMDMETERKMPHMTLIFLLREIG